MARQERPIRGRVIAITGAARGIGRATAERLAAEGGRVAIGDLADEAATVAATLDGEVIGLGLDVTDPASVAGFLDEVESRLGPLDVLVNNAGIMMVGPFADEDDAGTAREFAVNVLGVVYGMRHAIRRMSRNGGGHIVNVASLASWFTTPGEATYSATKHAVRGLTESVRFELRDQPIELTSVYPGVVDTELAAGTGSGKLLQPDQIADAIAGAVRRPRAEVFVPASTGPFARLNTALRPRTRQALGRLLKVDKVATHVQDGVRTAYETRATAGLAQPVAGDTGGVAAGLREGDRSMLSRGPATDVSQ